MEQTKPLDHTLKNARALIAGDGCTSSPELWLHDACTEHDRAYTTHLDADLNPITRAQADKQFLRNALAARPWKTIPGALICYGYYFAVRIFGRPNWTDEKIKA